MCDDHADPDGAREGEPDDQDHAGSESSTPGSSSEAGPAAIPEPTRADQEAAADAAEKAHAREQGERIKRYVENLDDYAIMGDINTLPSHIIMPMEMNRRLKGSIENLTDVLGSFKQSSDALAGQVVTLTQRLLWFTVAVAIMTLILVALTITQLVS